MGGRARARTSAWRIAGFPNLFTITGPGSPSVLSNMMVSIEQHVESIATLLQHLRDHGLTSIEPTAAAEDAWVEHVNAQSARRRCIRAPTPGTWAPMCPASRACFMPYVGGVGRYRQICERVVANGFEGFALRGPQGRELAVVPAGAFA